MSSQGAGKHTQPVESYQGGPQQRQMFIKGIHCCGRTDFHSSISQAMAKAMEHLSDFVFVTVANSTLARRDAYLSHLKAGIKPDTLAALRTAPLQMTTLFPDEVLKQAEQDIATFESKNQPLSNKKGRFHPYERTEKRSDNRKPERPAWKNIGHRGQGKKGRGRASHYTPRPAKG